VHDDATLRPELTNGGPWRYLMFDPSDPADPKWVVLSVTTPGDVRPADVDEATGHKYTDWQAVCAWVREQVGRGDVALFPMDRVLVWKLDEHP
jgi:hypothetical protein